MSIDNYTNHSGGAYGVDTMGCVIGLGYGFTNHRHYRPENNQRVSPKLRSRNIEPVVIDSVNLKVARDKVNELTGKKYKNDIAGNLQARNYYQVDSADAIFCFSRKNGDAKIAGGTNTALQLAIMMRKTAYVFDIKGLKWFVYNEGSESLCECTESPVLTEHYAIIGTRDVEDYLVKDKKSNSWISRKNYVGVEKSKAVYIAIENLYKKTLEVIVK